MERGGVGGGGGEEVGMEGGDGDGGDVCCERVKGSLKMGRSWCATVRWANIVFVRMRDI